MPKRCNVLLETVKELPPLQVLEKKGDGLCHGRPVKAQNLWERACGVLNVRHWCNGQS